MLEQLQLRTILIWLLSTFFKYQLKYCVFWFTSKSKTNVTSRLTEAAHFGLSFQGAHSFEYILSSQVIRVQNSEHTKFLLSEICPTYGQILTLNSFIIEHTGPDVCQSVFLLLHRNKRPSHFRPESISLFSKGFQAAGKVVMKVIKSLQISTSVSSANTASVTTSYQQRAVFDLHAPPLK